VKTSGRSSAVNLIGSLIDKDKTRFYPLSMFVFQMVDKDSPDFCFFKRVVRAAPISALLRLIGIGTAPISTLLKLISVGTRIRPSR